MPRIFTNIPIEACTWEEFMESRQDGDVLEIRHDEHFKSVVSTKTGDMYLYQPENKPMLTKYLKK